MKKLALVLGIISCFFSVDVLSQDVKDFIIPQGRKYLYQDVLVTYDQLDIAFSSNAQAFYHFDRARSQSKAAKVWGFTSLGLIGGGILAVSDFDSRGHNYGPLIAGVLMILAAPIPGIIGIIIYAKSKDNKKKSIRVFNGMEIHGNLAPEQNHELFLGMTAHGVGVTYSF